MSIYIRGNAQGLLEFNIVSFKENPFSITATEKRFERIDDDGYRYAIIKVRCSDNSEDLDGFTFDFGALNSKVERHNDELWVYVQRNAKTVTIKRQGYKPIYKYNLNTTVRSGATYDMDITMSHVRSFIERDITKQVLQFVVTPSTEKAIVKVRKSESSSDYELWGEVDESGSIDRIMDFGTYDYVVSAQDYEPSEGRVTLTDSKKTFVEKVVLKPDFGYLVVDDKNGSSGAQLFIDDVKVGTIPYKEYKKRWSCGEHRITVTNGDLYKPYNSSFTIGRGDTTVLSPVLEADYAQTTVYVDADAEILIDGQLKGNKKWVGPLKAGKYVVECRQAGHRPSNRIVLVEADKSETFEIPAPIAIKGSMYVSSSPSGAEILVDGVAHGTSPKLIQGVLIGEHDIALSLQNHKTEHCKVAVKEDETINISVKLSDVADMTIGSYPTNAELSINGEKVGKTPFKKRMSSGDYEIELFHKNYEVYRNRVHLDSSNPSLLIRMKKQYQRYYSFYIQPFVQLGGNMSIGGSVGGYIANVNVEGYYAMSTKESEMIYWNTTSKNGKTCGYSYKASCIGGKIGYGLILNRTMRVTPQIGVEVINLNSSKEYNVSAAFDASKANVVNASVGVKYEYAFTNNIGAFVVPTCSFAMKKSDYFSDMEQVSSIIKAYVSTFSLRTGISIFF